LDPKLALAHAGVETRELKQQWSYELSQCDFVGAGQQVGLDRLLCDPKQTDGAAPLGGGSWVHGGLF
jgi:hypothetical protein